MSNKKKGPYHYNRSEAGTYWTEGPGTMFMRFDTEAEAEHFCECMNDAWAQGRKTGRQDVAIAQAIEQEPMKKEPRVQLRGFGASKYSSKYSKD